MQVTELESKKLQKNFKIVVPAATIKEQIEAELRVAGQRVKMPGFRPGNIPMKILKQRYGASVQGDVLKQVINQSSSKALADKKIRPAMTPQINIEDYKEGGDLAFTLTCEAFPEIPEVAFDKITLDRKTFEISEEDINETEARIAERSPKLNRAEAGAKAQLGNVLSLDFKGMIDGVAFKGGSAEGFRLELGSKQFIEGFEEQLVGTKEGDEKTVKVTFPKDYQGKDVAGKEAEFVCKVHEIFVKESPKIDDEFAKERGFADAKALRDAIKNQMIKEYDQAVRTHLKKELFDVLEAGYDFDLPQGMVDLEFNSIWERLKEAQAQGDESFAGKDEAELKKEYEQIARRRVKLGLLLADIGNRNKIQINQQELTQAVMQQARMFPGQEKKVMEFYQKNPERVDDLRGPILEEKAVDFVLGKVKFNDTKVALIDLAGEDDEISESEQKKKESKAKSSKKSEEGAHKKPSAKKKGEDAKE